MLSPTSSAFVPSPFISPFISLPRRRPSHCGQPPLCTLPSAPPAAAVAVADALRRDLPLQYTSPQSMDFSVYGRRILFTDPLTRLRGVLNYTGMIWTIAVVARVLFRPETVSFELEECEVVRAEEGEETGEDGRGIYVRTRFVTKGETRWSASGSEPVVISGIDKFYLARDLDKITWHESAWDQTPDLVKQSFLRRGE